MRGHTRVHPEVTKHCCEPAARSESGVRHEHCIFIFSKEREDRDLRTFGALVTRMQNVNQRVSPGAILSSLCSRRDKTNPRSEDPDYAP